LLVYVFIIVSILAAAGRPAATDVRTKEECNDIISIRTVHRMTNGDFVGFCFVHFTSPVSIRADG